MRYLYALLVVLLSNAFTGTAHPADYEIILKRNIFAPIPEPREEKPPPARQPLPVIRLPELEEVLELRGTLVVRDNPSENFAIIENRKTREMDFYRRGDVIESALITGIEENAVLFEYGYRQVRLARTGSSFTRIYADAEYRVNLGELLETFSKEAISPFPVRSEPVVENGRTKGFMISGIPEDSVLAKYGIENRDIITMINTIPMDGPEKPFYAYESIMKYGIRTVAVRLYRDSLPYILLYRLN